MFQHARVVATGSLVVAAAACTPATPARSNRDPAPIAPEACPTAPLASLDGTPVPPGPLCNPSTRPLPATVEEARAGRRERMKRVVRAWLRSFDGDWDDFGDWDGEAARVGLPRVLAGLKARELFTADDSLAPPADFAMRAERWILQNAKTRRQAGTDTSAIGGPEGDYDFVMMQMLELIYQFRERPDLLSNDSVWALLESERDVVRTGRGKRSERRIPEVGNHAHRMTFRVLVSFPETENHVLLTNTWAYLVNQWLARDYRNDARVRRYFARSPQKFRNEGSALERVLLRAMARVVQNGFFETNARPYQAYSLRALQLLASYADTSRPGGKKIQLAAENALDYAATKFAFQSFEGKRLGPSRRNYKHRKSPAVYQNDYVPYLFGVLTGAHVYDDDPWCDKRSCAYSTAQARSFALGSALSSYEVPEVVWDFMLRPDNHQNGHGVWARMQARFTERHYLGGQWPRQPGQKPNLNLAVERGDLALEPAPELYFITRSFMNSAGGRAERYQGQDGWTFGRYRRVYDMFSKPSVLLPSGDLGYWRDVQELEEQTLAFRGNSARFWDSNNTGVYKNFVYGYASKGFPAPARPRSWLPSLEKRLGRTTLEFFDLSANNALGNPRLDLYVVTGAIEPRGEARPRLGFWEVFPVQALQSVDAVADCVQESNARLAADGDAPLVYTLCLSGDQLGLNEGFGRDANAFLSINGSREALRREQLDLQSRAALASFPLIEAREVDAKFRFTGVTYALATGDGLLTIQNPHLGRRLVIDARRPYQPSRRLELIPKRVP